MTRGSLSIERMRDGPGRREVLAVLEVILVAADPYRLVKDALRVSSKTLHVGKRSLSLHGRRVLVIGLGKASRAMARAANSVLGDSLERGIIVVPAG